MSDSISTPQSPGSSICLQCGLCCNGTIFADVKLLAHEKAAPLQSLGLRLSKTAPDRRSGAEGKTASSRWRFPQPCSAFDGCRCRIYSSRPQYCREFECLLLKQLNQGKVTRSSALRVIRSALQEADEVRQLLRALGDMEESLALAARFHRMTRSLTRVVPGLKTAELYGRLTLAFHKLRLTVDKAFYPAPSQK